MVSPDGTEHFVLEHSASRRRLLLPAQYYTRYGFTPGQTVECRVDKISCTGQLYLEPRHPCYDVGKSYTFPLVDINRTDSYALITVTDCFGSSIEVLLRPEEVGDSQKDISLRVTGIKKGVPLLAARQAHSKCAAIQEGTDLEVYCCDIVERNGERFYLFIFDHCFGLLKVSRFSHYGIEPGNTVSCRLLGFRPDGTLRLEPRNPFYRIGMCYDFTISAIQQLPNTEPNGSIAVIYDRFGKKCGVPIEGCKKQTYRAGDRIRCRVIGFRKGRPDLEIVP